jgi:hypothetical protein
MKPVACNKFHANSFLLINTQDKPHWLSFNHVIRRREFFPLVVVMSTKKETTNLGTSRQRRTAEEGFVLL